MREKPKTEDRRRRTAKIDIKLLRIDEQGYHLLVKARINGKVANMLLDTGASQSVFDMNRLDRFLDRSKTDFEKNHQLSTGLGTNSVESQFTKLRSFVLGGYRERDMLAIVLDLSHVNKSYEMIGLKPIDGVIGSDLLLKLKAKIDFNEKTLTIRFVG